MNPRYTLVSHALCPYVQRAAIVLTEKGLDFERKDIDLANKPQWFLDCSPLGKTPVLLVDGQAVFESAAICDFLDESHAPTLHPRNVLERAQHRAWIAFASETLQSIAGFYSASDEPALSAKAHDLHTKFCQVEAALAASRVVPTSGPPEVAQATDNPGSVYFSGQQFSAVDAAFAPVFRYFDVLDHIADFGVLSNLPHVNAWRAALRARPSVVDAVSSHYPALLHNFLARRNGALAQRMQKRAQEKMLA